MKNLLFFITLLMITTGYAQSNMQLASRLAAMVVADQQAAGLPPAGMTSGSPAWVRFQDSVFTAHHDSLRQIFTTYGYPGIDLVGESGATDFWLLVQHLDRWPAFQQQVLDAMFAEVSRNNASAENFAYLRRTVSG